MICMHRWLTAAYRPQQRSGQLRCRAARHTALLCQYPGVRLTPPAALAFCCYPTRHSAHDACRLCGGFAEPNPEGGRAQVPDHLPVADRQGGRHRGVPPRRPRARLRQQRRALVRRDRRGAAAQHEGGWAGSACWLQVDSIDPTNFMLIGTQVTSVLVQPDRRRVPAADHYKTALFIGHFWVLSGSSSYQMKRATTTGRRAAAVHGGRAGAAAGAAAGGPLRRAVQAGQRPERVRHEDGHAGHRLRWPGRAALPTVPTLTSPAMLPSFH